MATQIVMDHTGHTRHCFDPNDAQALASAEKRFMELTGLYCGRPKGAGRGHQSAVGRSNFTRQSGLRNCLIGSQLISVELLVSAGLLIRFKP